MTFMRRTSSVLVFGILFLLLIQMSGTLVESIYILDLMHTALDEKALGLFFFFAPAFLFFFRKRTPLWLLWGVSGLLFAARGVTPYLTTSGRLIASGVATGSGLILLGLLMAGSSRTAEDSVKDIEIPAGMALAVMLSAMLRAVNSSIDLSLTNKGGWLGWGLGLLLLAVLVRSGSGWQLSAEQPTSKKRELVPALLGIFFVFILIYFGFSAPSVISRWTGGDYVLIVITISLQAAVWGWIAICRPQWFSRFSRQVLVLWNAVFACSLVWTLLAQRVAFPQTPDEVVIVTGAVTPGQSIPLVLMMLLFPVLLVDLRVFWGKIWQENLSPAELAPGLLLGAFVMVLLVFINIFTNVWGYISPISTPFRNLFWLPFLLSAGGLSVLVAIQDRALFRPLNISGRISWGWTGLLTMLVLVTAGGTWLASRNPPLPSGLGDQQTIIVMTDNIQAGNDSNAEPAYDRQLDLIRRVSPDILALQESDTARISLNNNDIVRYFSDHLGYYSYYGPGPVAGTFGTAILSKHPLTNQKVIYSYSDTDEIGTTVVQVEYLGKNFTIYNVHPAGSDEAKRAFANAVLEQAQNQDPVIILGDFNSRKTDQVYQLMVEKYNNAWTSVYPTEISPDGTDMSGRNRIDHIFLSPGLLAENPVYVLPPESATDHPVHWTEIYIDQRRP